MTWPSSSLVAFQSSPQPIWPLCCPQWGRNSPRWGGAPTSRPAPLAFTQKTCSELTWTGSSCSHIAGGPFLHHTCYVWRGRATNANIPAVLRHLICLGDVQVCRTQFSVPRTTRRYAAFSSGLVCLFPAGTLLSPCPPTPVPVQTSATMANTAQRTPTTAAGAIQAAVLGTAGALSCWPTPTPS